MQEELKTLIEEGREFVRIKRTYEGARFPDAGTPAFVISTEWLAKYKIYIFYSDLRYNATPSVSDPDHVSSRHPGKITNESVLDLAPKFLKGTGEGADLEADVVDRYLHKDARERTDFEFINEEMWKFLAERYGFDTTIKRYYVSRR